MVGFNLEGVRLTGGEVVDVKMLMAAIFHVKLLRENWRTKKNCVSDKLPFFMNGRDVSPTCGEEIGDVEFGLVFHEEIQK